jgi:DNA-binding PucR family transcriptional regulator
MIPPVAEAYQQEREAHFRDREQRKRRLVRDLIAGLPVDTSQLAYDLSRPQLALIAWGKEPDRAIMQLGDTAGCQLLTVPGASDVLWGWLSGRALRDYDSARLRRFAPPEGTCVAIGEVLDGVDGFRRTHEQAWQAYQVASIKPQPVTLYRDISLVALVLRDRQGARNFVAEELGELAASDPKATMLRETLSAYFAAGQNAAAAAAALRIHDRTVAYRVRSAETRLGFPISTRRDELGVALRLAELFSDEPAARSPA